MDLFLVRHGHAKSELEDSRRPLSPQWLKDVETIGRALLVRNVSPAEVWHSDRLRATEPAEILSRALRPRATLEIAGLGPEDDPFWVQAELAAAEAEGSVMLVGHLPHMARLLSLLVHGEPGRHVIDFPPAGVACLAGGQSRWEVAWTLWPDSL